jgi:hypothetical protein
MPEDKKRIPAKLLFERLQDRGTSAAFAKALEMSPQRLSNWKTRGIPASELPQVAAALGISVEEYLAASGRPVTRLEQPMAPYVTREEQQLLDDYRKASPSWQLSLRLLAKLPSGEQENVSTSVNVLLAKIAADPVPDSRLNPNWTRPDRRKPR